MSCIGSFGDLSSLCEGQCGVHSPLTSAQKCDNENGPCLGVSNGWGAQSQLSLALQGLWCHSRQACGLLVSMLSHTVGQTKLFSHKDIRSLGWLWNLCLVTFSWVPGERRPCFWAWSMTFVSPQSSALLGAVACVVRTWAEALSGPC